MSVSETLNICNRGFVIVQVVHLSAKPKSTVRDTVQRLQMKPYVEARPAAIRLLKQLGAVPPCVPKVACIPVCSAIKLLTALYANPSITQYLWKLRKSDPPATRNRPGSSINATPPEPRCGAKCYGVRGSQGITGGSANGYLHWSVTLHIQYYMCCTKW